MSASFDEVIKKKNFCWSWQVSDTETRLECLLNNNKNSDFCAPLTSFDWNEVDPNLLGENNFILFLWIDYITGFSGRLFQISLFLTLNVNSKQLSL